MNTNCGRGLVLIRALRGKSPCICSSASLLSSSSTIYLLHRLRPSRYVTAQLCPFITSLQLSLHNFSHNSTSALLTNCLLLPFFFFFIPFDCFFPGVFSSCKSLCLLPFITQPSPLSALLALSRPLLPPTLPFHLPAPVHLVDAFIQSACFELTLYEYCNRSENRPYMYYSFFFCCCCRFFTQTSPICAAEVFFFFLSVNLLPFQKVPICQCTVRKLHDWILMASVWEKVRMKRQNPDIFTHTLTFQMLCKCNIISNMWKQNKKLNQFNQ